MPFEQALTLKIANREDFTLPVLVVAALSVLSALLSPQPVLLAVFVLLVFATNRVLLTLNIFKINNVKLTSVIFTDGQVKLKSDRQDIFGGFLTGQQWCTRHIAVLRIINKQGRTKRLVILSTQQQSADVFRRLNVWLRQDLCKGTQDQQVSLS
jgi:hypothetical protein